MGRVVSGQEVFLKSHGPDRAGPDRVGSDQDVFEISRVGSGRAGSDRVESGGFLL